MNKENMPFQVPSGYFGLCHRDMMSRIAQQEWTDQTPRLDMISSDVDVKVPAGYFGGLQSAVIHSLGDQMTDSESADLITRDTYQAPQRYFQKPPVVQKPSKAVPLFRGYHILTNIAATFLILIVIGALYFKPSTPANGQFLSMEMIDNSEWEQFLDSEDDVYMSRGNDPIVNLDYISKQEVNQFLREEEEYLSIF